MNLPGAIYACRWLIRDTFRQARAAGVFWFMLAITGLFVLLCLSVRTVGSASLEAPKDTPEFLPRRHPPDQASNVPVVAGELTIAFGAIRVPLGRDARDGIRFLQLLLAGTVADTAGVLLVLVWTAGFVPAFLEPSAAAVLLAKPIPRWWLLLGKFLGVLTFVAFQASVFVGGTYVALGLATGYWEARYLLCIPVLLLHFAVFYSFSVMLAVWTRSTILCVVGSVVFWILCWGMNFGRHALVAAPPVHEGVPPLPAGFLMLADAAYWILPKPADLGVLLSDLLQAGKHFASIKAFEEVQRLGAFQPELSILADVLFGAAMIGVSARQLAHTDY